MEPNEQGVIIMLLVIFSVISTMNWYFTSTNYAMAMDELKLQRDDINNLGSFISALVPSIPSFSSEPESIFYSIDYPFIYAWVRYSSYTEVWQCHYGTDLNGTQIAYDNWRLLYNLTQVDKMPVVE